MSNSEQAAGQGSGMPSKGRRAYEVQVADNQYLLLSAGEVNFAIPILAVREILEPPAVTRVPLSPPWMSGLTNLRGQVLPVMSLAQRLNLNSTIAGDRSVLVVIDLVMRQGIFQRGVIVDKLGGIIDVDEKEIRDYDAVGQGIPREYVRGLLPLPPNFAILLDLDYLFKTTTELAG